MRSVTECSLKDLSSALQRHPGGRAKNRFASFLVTFLAADKTAVIGKEWRTSAARNEHEPTLFAPIFPSASPQPRAGKNLPGRTHTTFPTAAKHQQARSLTCASAEVLQALANLGAHGRCEVFAEQTDVWPLPDSPKQDDSSGRCGNRRFPSPHQGGFRPTASKSNHQFRWTPRPFLHR